MKKRLLVILILFVLMFSNVYAYDVGGGSSGASEGGLGGIGEYGEGETTVGSARGEGTVGPSGTGTSGTGTTGGEGGGTSSGGYCGDGICNSYLICSSGNGNCYSYQEDSTNCPQDCRTTLICNNDGTCNTWEFQLTCPHDCCDDDCTNGQRRCSSNSYQICGNYDNDVCYEYSSLVNCGGGAICDSGYCMYIEPTPVGPTTPTTPTTCTCNWVNQGCNIGGCTSPNRMYQIKLCSPAGCDSGNRCVYDSSCLANCPGATCQSLGYQCGTHTICGKRVDCTKVTGGCQLGYTCNYASGKCSCTQTENREISCNDNRDNDCDYYVDRNDPDCCTRKTCGNYQGQCGTLSDNCGNTINCNCNSGYLCSNRQCISTACTTNSNCNDNNLCTNDVCNNPGLSNAFCSNAFITICNDNNLCTTDTCNRNTGCQYTLMTCESGKTCRNGICCNWNRYDEFNGQECCDLDETEDENCDGIINENCDRDNDGVLDYGANMCDPSLNIDNPSQISGEESRRLLNMIQQWMRERGR